jgi:trigger factor
LKVSTERVPDAQILMTIEVEQERLEEARNKAIRKLSPKAKVPGFRPGKAPPDMVRRYFGEEHILDEALDDLVPAIYREAIEADESIEPIARPQIVVETTEPLVVKATIPVRPTVELADYKAVRVEIEPVTVDEARVEETLTVLRRRAATLEPADRPIAWRDVVRLEVEGFVEVEGAAPTLVDASGRALMASKQREPFVNKQEAEVQLLEGQPIVIPGFAEQVLGKSKGDSWTFELPMPDGLDERFNGKQAQFNATILEVKEEVLPELDDEFAKAVGEGFESVDALRQRIHDDIEKAEEEARENRWHDEILGKIVEQSTIEYPPVMVDAEVDRMLHDQFGHVQHEKNFEEYLQSIGTTLDQVRAQARPIAEERLKRGLVLGKVTEAEGIEIKDEDVAEESERLSIAAGQQADQFKQLFGSDEGKATIRRNLLTRDTLARLVEFATQDGAQKVAGEKAAPEKKKRGKAKVEAPTVDAAESDENPEAEEPRAEAPAEE